MTARQTYEQRCADIDSLILLIQSQLHNHALDAMTRPEHWGPAGDLAFVRQQLKDVLVFLMKSDSERIAGAEIEQHLADMRGDIR